MVKLPRPLPCGHGDDDPLDGPVEGALRGGRHDRPVHRLRGVRHRLPPRRHRLQARGRRATGPSTSRTSSGPADCTHGREGLHLLHPGLPPLPGLGVRRQRAPLRPRARADSEMYGITKDLLLCRASRRHGPPDRPGRRLRVGPAHLGHGGGLHRLRPHLVPRGRRLVVEGAARASPRNKDEILASAGSRYTYSANTLAITRGAGEGVLEAGPRRHELPVVGAAGHVAPQGRQGGQALPVQHRAAVLEDVRRRHLPGAVRGQVRPRARRTW